MERNIFLTVCAACVVTFGLAMAFSAVYDRGVSDGREKGVATLSEAITCRKGVTDPMTVIEIGSKRFAEYQKLMTPSPEAVKNANKAPEKAVAVVAPTYCGGW